MVSSRQFQVPVLQRAETLPLVFEDSGGDFHSNIPADFKDISTGYLDCELYSKALRIMFVPVDCFGNLANPEFSNNIF